MIVIAGSTEGVGTSTVCLNLALAWGRSQKRRVLIVPMDPDCPTDLHTQLRCNSPMLNELAECIDGDPERLGAELHALIPVNDWGVGVLRLAANQHDALRLAPMYVSRVFSALIEHFDLFIDTGAFLPMRLFSFRIADVIFHVSHPSLSDLKETAAQLSAMQARELPIERSEIVINEGGTGAALAPKAVTRFLMTLQKRVLVWLPHEKALPQLKKAKKVLVIDFIDCEWVNSGLAVLLGRTLEARPRGRDWRCLERAWTDFK